MKNYDPNHDDYYVISEHVITLIYNEQDPTKVRMYLDEMEFHSDNFCKNPNTLSLYRGKGSEFIGGHFEFSHDKETAYGAFEEGSVKEEAFLQLKPPEFDVALSKDAGAYVDEVGNKLQLHWDVTSDAWKGAHWSGKEMLYSYSVKPGKPIAGQPTYIFSATFTDNQTGVVWNVDNDPMNFDGFASITIGSEGRVVFSKNLAIKPLNPDRDSVDFPKIFPDDMVYDINELGTLFDGAICIGSKVEDALVYAMHGTPKNLFILGEYMLHNDSRPQSTFAVSNGKLLLNKVRIPKSGVKHNTLWWNDLTEEQVKSSGLPQNGQFEFSKDGKSGIILKKSKEEKFLTARTRPLRNFSPNDLTIYALIAMDPNSQSPDGSSDVVQGDSMEAFYRIIQYFMDETLRETFISLNPPDMSGITGIAQDNPTNNSEFYSFISIPYLVNALSNSTEKGSDKLNGVRAAKMMKQGFLSIDRFSKVYQDQTQKLYTRSFIHYFPLMGEFLHDQAVNWSDYIPVIVKDSEEWIATFAPVEGETEDDKKAKEAAIDVIRNLVNSAIQRKIYWAYALFRYGTSNYFLTWLQAQLLSPNGSSQTLSLTVKKYVTLLQVLDPSGEFSEQYLVYLKQYQFMSVLPQLLQLDNLSEDFNIIMMKILQQFVDTYIDSSDPQMADTAKILQEQIRLNNLQPFFDTFKLVLQQNPGGSWAELVTKFQNKMENFLGKWSVKIANVFVTGVASISIMFLLTGTVKWSDLSPIDQASFIVLTFSLFIKVSIQIVKGVLKARAIYIAVGGSWCDVATCYFSKKWKLPFQSEEYLENGFAKWLVEAKGPKGKAGTQAMNAAQGAEEMVEAEQSMGKMERAFGKNLEEFVATRLATIFATVNIILSAIQLANSDTFLEKAMNSLFLVSGILEFISIIGTWAIGAEAVAAGSALATTFGIASALSVVGAVLAAIIMIVILATHKTPPTPLENFVNDQAAKAGYKMEYGVDIDYFVVNKIDDLTTTIGLSISEDSGFKKCIRVSNDKTFDISALSYGFDTVWEISTDEFGYAKFATFVNSSDLGLTGIFLKLKDGVLVAEGSVADEDKETYQWICKIIGEPNYTTDSENIGENTIIHKYLQGATFTIKNLASSRKGVNDYVNVENGKLVVNENPKEWMLSMQGMKPDYLTVKNFILGPYDYTAQLYPRLLQPGSGHTKIWSLTPDLPDFLEFDPETGDITQKAPVTNFRGIFTLKVTNKYGSVDATFNIDARTEI